MELFESKDKVYRKVERTVENIRTITGSTLIRHKLRVELRLSLREYVFLDFIYQWHEKNTDPATYGDFWVGTGLFPRWLDRMFPKLHAKGMLFRDPADGMVKTTDNWNNNFNNSEQFESLWKLLNTGTKNVAKTTFAKALKVDTFESIHAGLVKYIEFKKEVDQFPVHLATFLNPKNKIWQGPFNADPYKKNVNNFNKVNTKTGPKSKV